MKLRTVLLIIFFVLAFVVLIALTVWLIYEATRDTSCTLFAFGNSLTDNGVDTNDGHGFRRYSNGPVWPDYLARMLKCRSNNVHNYAYSGAMSSHDNYYFKGWSGTLWQVEAFLKQYPNIPDHAIVAIELGGLNDLFKTVGANETMRATVAYEIVKNNLLSFTKLWDAGITKILIIDIFEPESHCPASKEDWFSPHVTEFAQSIEAINKMFWAKLRKLPKVDEVTIIKVKTENMWHDIETKFAFPEEMYTHHTENSTWAYWLLYPWYDEYHLTTTLHEMLAWKAFELWQAED